MLKTNYVNLIIAPDAGKISRAASAGCMPGRHLVPEKYKKRLMPMLKLPSGGIVNHPIIQG